MADEHQEAVLRKSLDAVDRGRRWTMLGVGAVVLATVLAIGEFLWTAQQSRAPAPENYGVVNMLLVAVIAQMLLTACCTAIVVFHGARMTRAVLQRIELIRRDPDGRVSPVGVCGDERTAEEQGIVPDPGRSGAGGDQAVAAPELPTLRIDDDADWPSRPVDNHGRHAELLAEPRGRCSGAGPKLARQRHSHGDTAVGDRAHQ